MKGKLKKRKEWKYKAVKNEKFSLLGDLGKRDLEIEEN